MDGNKRVIKLMNQKRIGCGLIVLGIAAVLYGVLQYLAGYLLDPKDASDEINYWGLLFTLAGVGGLIAGFMMRSRSRRRD
ncbi:MAG: hypothetical protein ACREBU_25665 [Nitrososphaera sp.]